MCYVDNCCLLLEEEEEEEEEIEEHKPLVLRCVFSKLRPPLEFAAIAALATFDSALVWQEFVPYLKRHILTTHFEHENENDASRQNHEILSGCLRLLCVRKHHQVLLGASSSSSSSENEILNVLLWSFENVSMKVKVPQRILKNLQLVASGIASSFAASSSLSSRIAKTSARWRAIQDFVMTALRQALAAQRISKCLVKQYLDLNKMMNDDNNHPPLLLVFLAQQVQDWTSIVLQLTTVYCPVTFPMEIGIHQALEALQLKPLTQQRRTTPPRRHESRALQEIIENLVPLTLRPYLVALIFPDVPPESEMQFTPDEEEHPRQILIHWCFDAPSSILAGLSLEFLISTAQLDQVLSRRWNACLAEVPSSMSFSFVRSILLHQVPKEHRMKHFPSLLE